MLLDELWVTPFVKSMGFFFPFLLTYSPQTLCFVDSFIRGRGFRTSKALTQPVLQLFQVAVFVQARLPHTFAIEIGKMCAIV